MDFNIEYEPWENGAGIVNMGLNAVLNLGPIKISYNITKASYGMFKTENYTGAMDFSSVKNSDKFKTNNAVNLFSYDDGESITSLTGTYGRIDRGSALNFGSSGRLMSDDSSAIRNKSLGTLTPQIVPLNDNKAILFMLADDAKRGVNDCSAVSYCIIDANGNASDLVLLDDDNTFDSNLSAAKLADGRVLVVWSDVNKSYGDDENAAISDILNNTDMSYCIFDADGNPGTVGTLSDQAGCEALPRIASDEKTGKTLISYTLTDYKTTGVDFGEDNLDALGDFLYNSYSTVCFKMLDPNGAVLNSYADTESAYTNYENSTGENLDGMRYLNVQLADDQSQSTIDEISSASKDGKVYIVYSLDTNANTKDDGDRELFMVTYDMETMTGTAPVRLTNNLTADTNPQLINYQGNIELYWNNNGSISYIILSDISDDVLAAGEDLAAEAYTLEDMASAAQTFTLSPQPDGNLYMLWNALKFDDNNKQGKDKVYIKGYDADYEIKDKTTNEVLGKGAWGSADILETDEVDNGDFSELCCTTLPNGRVLLVGKITDKDNEENITGYEAFYDIYESESSIDINADVTPAYPVAGVPAVLNVKGTNVGMLPSDKVTVKAQLAKRDGSEATDLGSEEINGHFQSMDYFSKAFDFTMPEDPQDYQFVITAWENDLSDTATVIKKDLPTGTSMSLSDADLRSGKTNSYETSFDIENSGNKEFGGGYIKIEKEPETWNEPNNTEQPVVLKDNIGVDTIAAKSTIHEYMTFDLPSDKTDADGMNEITIMLYDASGTQVAEKTLFINKTTTTAAANVEDIYINDAAGTQTINMKSGESKTIEAAVMPITAREMTNLTYKVDDPSVAQIDTAGSLKALKKGTAKVTVSAYRSDSALFVNADNLAYNMDGNGINIDENGIPLNLSSAAASAPVFEKTIEVNVSETTQSSGSGGTQTVTAASPTKTAVPIQTAKPAETAAPESSASPSTGLPFTDIKANDWFFDGVKYAYEKHLFSGISDSLFAPDEPMTRAMLVTVLYRAAGSPDMSKEIWGYPFEDVDSESWYGAAVYWARMNDIVKGISYEKFAPNDAITREQLAAILKRYAEFKGLTSDETNDLSQFTDSDNTADWALNSIKWAVGEKLIEGKDNNILDPGGKASRAEVAAILKRFFEAGTAQ